jgi:uncharacterized membrane protein YdjX (TVP38/TMEM64 family)
LISAIFTKSPGRFAAAVILLLLLLVGGYVLAVTLSSFSTEDIVRLLSDAHRWGPAMIVGMMVLAIVFSPIPSAPITVAAGAAYGHLWGTMYALIGAEIGALVAFEITRRLGQERAQRLIGSCTLPKAARSQLGLALTVFAMRLFPAISFDVVSYAAGLTVLQRRWFALATAAGMVPATFLLSHAGAGLRNTDNALTDILGSLAGLGVLMLVAVLYVKKRRQVQRLPVETYDAENP